MIDYPLTKDLATLIAYSHEFPGTIQTEYPNQDLLMRVQEKFIDAFEAGTDTPEASAFMEEFRKAHESFLLRVPKLTLPGVITFWALAVPPELAQEEDEFFVEKIGEVIGLYFFEGEPAEFVRRLVERHPRIARTMAAVIIAPLVGYLVVMVYEMSSGERLFMPNSVF